MPLPLRPRIFASGPAGTLQEYRAVCVGENSAPVAARLEAHLAEIGRMSARAMARFGARLLLDARGVGGGGDGEEKEEGGGGKGEEGEPGFEVEVLVVRRRDVGGVQARRVLLAGREDLGRVLGEEGDVGVDEDGWFESS